MTADGAPWLSIVAPAYNEEARLPRSLERLVAFAADQPFDTEIIVSDDGSNDATGRIVEDRTASGLPERVCLRTVRSETNQGKGAAIRRGVLAARGQYVFFVDADLATPPDEILRLLPRLNGGADIAIGSRIQPDGSDMRASQPLRRRLAGRLFTLMRKALGVVRDIDDTQCPMKGFRSEVARDVFARTQLSGWLFDAELLFAGRRLGYRIDSAPVRWTHVEGSRLRVRPQQAFEVARDLVRLRLMHRGLGRRDRRVG